MRFSKPLEEWATALRHNIFLRARLTLTLFYVVVMALIMGIFSLLLYYSLMRNLSDSLQDKFEDRAAENKVYTRTTDQLESAILWGDGIGILLVTFFSYFLAGKTLKPIRRALEDQRHFSSDASHELRTPLSVIQSESEILLRSKNPSLEEYKATVQSTLEEVARMKKITEQLLIVARSEESAKKGFKKISLSRFVEHAVKSFGPAALAKKIKIHGDVDDGIFIYGVPDLIEHAVSNIVQNSIDYALSEGKIIIKLKKNRDKAVLEVSDTGIGIPKKDVPHIFERFYRAENGAGQKKGGSGLGLAIVQQIVKSHNGSINIESVEDKGTKVSISLPACSS